MTMQEGRARQEGGRRLTTLEKLLRSGRKFFLAHGFKNASLRKIVLDAGYTSGAFYGYFASKEDLFYAITDGTAQELRQIISSINQDMMAIPSDRRLFEARKVYFRRIPEIVDFLLDHPEDMRLLLTCSEGTKYENIMATMQNGNIEAINDGVDAYLKSTHQTRTISPRTVELLMCGYSMMLTRVILEETDREVICGCMREIAYVYEQGILSLIQAS